jgi:NhaA family Na+:H+ antiporter
VTSPSTTTPEASTDQTSTDQTGIDEQIVEIDDVGSPTRTRQVIRPLADFVHTEAGAGALLVGAAVVALVMANSPWSDSWFAFWHTEAIVRVGAFSIDFDLKQWVDDALMTLFFFVVGLEIKRELTLGDLRDPKTAALPIVAALGGMVVPALVFTAFNAGTVGARGWGIPMATDIAIVTGVVALIGRRAPSWLRLFLLALAIADDLGAIVVIAIFYSEGVSFGYLGLAVATVAAAALIRRRVDTVAAYLALGVLCWIALQRANVHPTLTGVAFGMVAPVLPKISHELVDADRLARIASVPDAVDTARTAKSSVSVADWLIHHLHPYSAFVVVPLFALANAGIPLSAGDLGDALTRRTTWGVILGLVVGKTVGIAVATWIALRTRIGSLPPGARRLDVVGAAMLGGIGFTVSLFVTELAFGAEAPGRNARLGVLVGSFVAAIAGTLFFTLRPSARRGDVAA